MSLKRHEDDEADGDVDGEDGESDDRVQQVPEVVAPAPDEAVEDGHMQDEERRHAAVAQVMGGFASLRVHPDVPDGARALRRLGLRLVTLTNGSTQVAERLFAAAAIREEFERLLSVEDAGVWKPARGAYEYVAATCGVDLSQMLLVAVHPWDIDGAARAGMSTAWVNRTGGRYPEYFAAATHTVTALTELAPLLAT